MLYKLRIALSVTTLVLAAVSAVDGASAIDAPIFGFDVSVQRRP
jgi:hypothetical protein